jgi:hypothetical protein
LPSAAEAASNAAAYGTAEAVPSRPWETAHRPGAGRGKPLPYEGLRDARDRGMQRVVDAKRCGM